MQLAQSECLVCVEKMNEGIKSEHALKESDVLQLESSSYDLGPCFLKESMVFPRIHYWWCQRPPDTRCLSFFIRSVRCHISRVKQSPSAPFFPLALPHFTALIMTMYFTTLGLDTTLLAISLPSPTQI